MIDKKFIVLHHSATKDSGTVSWSAIRKFHTETNGWRDIGYHFGVELVGDGYEILVGRQLHEDAAAVKEAGMNRSGIHICVIGDFDKEAPSPAQYRKTIQLVASLLVQLSLPTTAIVFHRMFAIGRDGKPYKSCPGNQFPALPQVRSDALDQVAAISR